MTYTNPYDVHTPGPSLVVPAFWGDVVRDDLQFLNNGPAFFGNGELSASETTTNNEDHFFDIPTERFDSDGMHSEITNTGRVTIQTPGKYLIVNTTWWNFNGTGVRGSKLAVNGTVTNGQQHSASYTEHATVCSVFERDLVAGDYLEPVGVQNSGTTLKAFLKQFAVIWVSR